MAVKLRPHIAAINSAGGGMKRRQAITATLTADRGVRLSVPCQASISPLWRHGLGDVVEAVQHGVLAPRIDLEGDGAAGR